MSRRHAQADPDQELVPLTEHQEEAVTYEAPPKAKETRILRGHFDRGPRVQTINSEPSLTKQEFKTDCDINHIINRYDNTGLIAHLNRAAARFLDVTQVTDYHDALNQVKAAEDAFMELPAKARAVFQNDPARFLDAAHDPEKRELLVRAGLVKEEASSPSPVSAPAEEATE